MTCTGRSDLFSVRSQYLEGSPLQKQPKTKVDKEALVVFRYSGCDLYGCDLYGSDEGVVPSSTGQLAK